METLSLLPCQFLTKISWPSQKSSHLGPPLEPELEDVVVPAALDDLVAGVVLHVVDLVRLEQVVRGHLVAVDQESLIFNVIIFRFMNRRQSQIKIFE